MANRVLPGAVCHRCAGGAHYFAELSEDAVPALIAAAEQSTGTVREVIEKDLRRRSAAMGGDKSWRGWQSFHWSRFRAYRLLAQLSDERPGTGTGLEGRKLSEGAMDGGVKVEASR